VIDCSGYEYLGSRPATRMKKALEKSLTFVQKKMKLFFQIAQQSPEYGQNGTSISPHHLKRKRKPKEFDDLASSSSGVVNDTAELSLRGPQAVTGKKRSREEQKQDKLRRQSVDQQRKNRARDLERILKLIKEEETQNLTNRKMAANLQLERRAKDEEEQAASSTPFGSLSSHELDAAQTTLANDCYPLGRPLHLSGKTFGNCLELWVFLLTYSKPLRLSIIPSHEAFEKIFSSFQPLTKQLKFIHKKSSQLLGLTHSSGDSLSASASGIEKAHPMTEMRERKPLFDRRQINGGLFSYHLLNKVGIALSLPLLEEYSKIMGMESLVTTSVLVDEESQSSSPTLVSLPINEILWKEITRVVLVYTLCRSYGMSEYEAITCLKGKGYSIVGGDIHEKRIMKLIKRRISQRFSLQQRRTCPSLPSALPEVQTGSTSPSQAPHLGQEFQSGLVVSVPTPGLYLPPPPSPLALRSTSSDLMMICVELFYLLLFMEVDSEDTSKGSTTSLLITAQEIILSLLQACHPSSDPSSAQSKSSPAISDVVFSLQSSQCQDLCRGPHFYPQLKSTLLFLLQKIVQNLAKDTHSQQKRLTVAMRNCARDIISYDTPVIFRGAVEGASGESDSLRYEWKIPDTSGTQNSLSLTDETQSLIRQIKGRGAAAMSVIASARQLYLALSKMSASTTATCLYNHEQHRLMSQGGGEGQQEEETIGSLSPMAEKDDDGDEIDTPPPHLQNDLLLIESEEARATREAVQLLSLSDLSRRFHLLCSC
jgi:hypothetical protein